MITNEAIDGTPFNMVGTDEKGYWVTYGIFRLTEAKKTKEEALDVIREPNWNTIVSVVYSVAAGIRISEQAENKLQQEKGEEQ